MHKFIFYLNLFYSQQKKGFSAVFLWLLLGVLAIPVNAQPKIYEIYSAGAGISGATTLWSNDFIILSGFGPGGLVTGYSISYRASTNWLKIDLTGNADANGFFRIQCAGTQGGLTLPFSFNQTAAFSPGNSGNGALVSPVIALHLTTTTLTNSSCAGSIIDLCGYNGTLAGSAPQCKEGATAAPVTANATFESRRRKIVAGVIQDTDQNGNDFELISNCYVAPTFTTSAATSITGTSAVLGADITGGDGGNYERGIVYSTSSNPTISNTKVSMNSGTGTYSATVSGFTSGTTYFVRGYMLNGGGVTYGTQISFTAASGCTAPSITAAASSNSPICSGTTLNLSVGASGTAPLSYAWAGTGAFSDATVATPSVTGAVTGNYIVTVTNSCGSVSSTASVTVNTAPSITSAASSNSPICSGSALNLSVGAAGSAPLSYAWTGTGTFSDATVANPSVTGAVTGNYIVMVTNSCGNASSTASVTVNPSVDIPSFTSPVTTLCEGATATYTATAANSTNIAYSILAGGATINSSGVVSNVTGNFTVVATASGACGANTTVNQAVTVNPNVGTPSFTAPTTSLCVGGTATYTATAANSTGITYSILNNTGATIDANSGAVSNVTGNFTVVATASGACGANTTVNQAVTVNPNVGTPSFTAPTTTLCAGGTATYTATASNSSSITYSILSGGATIDMNTGVVSSVTGDFTVVATATGTCGANTTANQAVTVNPNVGTPSFTAPTTSLCVGGTATYTATAANSTSISYSILAGGASINSTTGEVSSVTGNFTVVATASGACGANTTANQAVTITPNVGTPSFTAPTTTLCAGGTATYTATAANSTNISYSILAGGASINSTTGEVSNVTGNFTVVATASGACGANTTANQAVTIVTGVGTPSFTGGATSLCTGGTSTYQATASNSTSVTYSILAGGASINSTTGEVSNVTGDFTVVATASGACGANTTANQAVTVATGAGTPSFTSGATNLCSNATSTYLATATNSTGVTYSIVGGTGASINATTGVVSAITGNFTVRATATGACGANTTADIAVTVPPIVTAPVFTVAPTPICSGVAETYTATATNATSIVYSTLSGNINPTTGVMSGSTGSFTVKATATDVCGISKATPFPVVVNKSPTLTITNPAAVTFPATVNITLKPGVIAGLYLGTLSYWTDAAASIQLSNPTAVGIGGTYYIKADNGSCSRIRPVVVTINTIRIKMSDDNVALIYPNPVENQLHILPSFPANSQISIYDAQGKMVLKERLSADSENLFSLEAMGEGLYIINISDENGNVLHSDKVVKQ